MNANILSLIFEYANKFEFPSPPQEEKTIVAHLAKLSLMQHIKAMAYNCEVAYLMQVINELNKAFGRQNVVIHGYYGNSKTFYAPGHVRISVTNLVDSFSLRTDMSYSEPMGYLPGVIEVLGGIEDCIYPSDNCREYKDVKDLIKAIRWTPYWEEIQHSNLE